MNELPLLLFAAFLGGFVQSATGFGSALVAMPLFLQVIDARTASPMQSLLSLMVSASVLWRNRKALDFVSARDLVFASVPGIPIGIFFLKTLPGRWIHFALGILLVAFSIWSIFFHRHPASVEEPAPTEPNRALRLPGRIATWLTGFCSGLLGGAYNTSGPPVVLYGTLRQWSPGRFKSVLSAYFVCEGIMLALFHSALGMITPQVLGYFVQLAPALIIGMAAGFFLERRIPRAQFTQFVLILLMLLGIKLILPH